METRTGDATRFVHVAKQAVVAALVVIAAAVTAFLATSTADQLPAAVLVDPDPGLPTDEEPPGGWPDATERSDTSDDDGTTSGEAGRAADAPDTEASEQAGTGTSDDDDLVGDLTDTLDEIVDDVTDTVEDVVEDTTDTVEDVVEDTTDTLEDATDPLDDTTGTDVLP